MKRNTVSKALLLAGFTALGTPDFAAAIALPPHQNFTPSKATTKSVLANYSISNECREYMQAANKCFKTLQKSADARTLFQSSPEAYVKQFGLDYHKDFDDNDRKLLSLLSDASFVSLLENKDYKTVIARMDKAGIVPSNPVENKKGEMIKQIKDHLSMVERNVHSSNVAITKDNATELMGEMLLTEDYVAALAVLVVVAAGVYLYVGAGTIAAVQLAIHLSVALTGGGKLDLMLVIAT